MINANLTTATRVGLNLLALLGIVIALRLGESVFIPTVIAVLLAAMLWPAAGWLNQRCSLPWSVSCLIVVMGLVFLNLVITLAFTLAVTKIVQGLPDPRTAQGQEDLYRSIRNPLANLFPDSILNEYFPDPSHPIPAPAPALADAPGEASPKKKGEKPPDQPRDKGKDEKAVDDDKQPAAEKKPAPVQRDWKDSGVFKLMKEALNPEKPYIIGTLWTLAGYGYSWLWQWVLVMFILLFLMLEGRLLGRRIVEIFGPSRHAQTSALGALADMAGQVRTYLVWRTLINFGLGLLVGLIYYAMGLNQAWTWALLTAVLCYIPYLGPIAAGVPPLLDAFVNCPSPWWVLGIAVFYTGLITLEGYVVVPVVMGRSMELNATTVMLACLFWELVWGLPGLFLAMPLMAALKAVCYHVPGWRPWANLMSTREDLPEVVDSNRPPSVFDDGQLIPADKVEAEAALQRKA